MKTSGILIFIVLLVKTGMPATPGLISYQGRLTDPDGNPVTTKVSVNFTFWNSEKGGLLLGGGFSDTDFVIPDSRGLYSTLIGDNQGIRIPDSVFAGDSVWLNVNIEGEDLLPRRRMTSVGYSLRADKATTAAVASVLGGAAFVMVETTSDPGQNGINLIKAYERAEKLKPLGKLLSADNRAMVIVPPGRYDLENSALLMDAEFVDVVGFTTERASQQIQGRSNGMESGVLMQSADDVRIVNVSVKCTRSTGAVGGYYTEPAAYYPTESPKIHTLIRNCEFTSDEDHAWSMRVAVEYAGTYENCTGGTFAFGGTTDVGGVGIASGTFTNCSGGDFAFGGKSHTTGKFTNSNDRSDLSIHNAPYETLIQKTFEPDRTDVYQAHASGTFTNCRGGNCAFGGYGTAGGRFTNCEAGSSSFGAYGISNGTFIQCVAGDNAFGGYGTASGTFTNCIAGHNSFGGHIATANGTFTNCTGGDGAFGGGTASGTFTNCTGGEYSFAGFYGKASGTFLRCVGGNFSFAGFGGYATGGKFFYCSGGEGSFTEFTGDPPPIYRFCLAGGAFYP